MQAHPASAVSSPAAKAQATLHRYDNAQAWYGADMRKRTDWVHRFSAEELGELDAAVARLRDRNADLVTLKREDFHLPTLGPRLDAIHDEIVAGRGFFLLRGLPVERYTTYESAIAFRGIGAYFGEAMSQNAKGHVLGHVKNLGLDFADPEVRNYQTDLWINYHTDFSDIVGLLCLRRAKAGGASSIVSSTTVWNELLQAHPEYAAALTQPLYWTRWGEIPEGKRRYAEIPVFMPGADRMIAAYGRTAFMKAQALPGVPRITELQNAALDALDALAADPRLRLDMDFAEGDMQFLCNHYIFHSRSAYQDYEDVTRRRHLLRLWLASDKGPALPSWIMDTPDSLQRPTARGRPNGICVPGVPLKAPLEAE